MDLLCPTWVTCTEGLGLVDLKNNFMSLDIS